MVTYIIIRKVGDPMTLEALNVEARGGALFFYGTDSVLAIYPLSELHAVYEKSTAEGLHLKLTKRRTG